MKDHIVRMRKLGLFMELQAVFDEIEDVKDLVTVCCDEPPWPKVRAGDTTERYWARFQARLTRGAWTMEHVSQALDHLCKVYPGNTVFANARASWIKEAASPDTTPAAVVLPSASPTESVRRAVNSRLEEERRTPWRLADFEMRATQVNVEGESPQRSLDSLFHRAGPGSTASAVTLLSAGVGEGKSWEMQRAAAAQSGGGGALSIYVPARELARVAGDGPGSLAQYLGVPRDALTSCAERGGLRTLIVDGIDEATHPTYQASPVQDSLRSLLYWLGGLPRLEGGVQVVLSARDTLMEDSSAARWLSDLAATADRWLGGQGWPVRARLVPRTPVQNRQLLEQYLCQHLEGGTDAAEAALRRVTDGAVSTALLTALTARHLLSASSATSVRTLDARAVMDATVRAALEREDRRPGCPSPLDARLEFLRRYFLTLAATDAPGMTHPELAAEPWIYASLEGRPPGIPWEPRLATGYEERIAEIRDRCLLKYQGNRMVAPHSAFAIHFVADAIEAHLRPSGGGGGLGGGGGEGGGDPGAAAKRSLADLRLGERTLAECLSAEAANPRSTLSEAFAELAGRGALPDTSIFDTLKEATSRLRVWEPRSDLRGAKLDIQFASTYALSRLSSGMRWTPRQGDGPDAPSSGEIRPGGLGPDEPPQKLTVGGTPFQLLPAGLYHVWRQASPDGPPALERFTLATPVYLSVDPVTVGQYARFLEANPAAPLPVSAKWFGLTRESETVRFDPACEHVPVTGVAAEEAIRYNAWLLAGRTVEVLGGHRHLTVPALPRADWLRAAGGGNLSLAAPMGREGAFGHRDLAGVVWQWCAEGGELRQFGGSAVTGLGEEYLIPLLRQPTRTAAELPGIVRKWPDLSRPAPSSTGHWTVGLRAVFQLGHSDE